MKHLLLVLPASYLYSRMIDLIAEEQFAAAAIGVNTLEELMKEFK